MPTKIAIANDAAINTTLATGRRVLRAESDALALYAETLDETFCHAVDLLLSIDGRVICSGMGKSGHIARKIAATMASTGTPAQFVHPAEASHGDLGMITQRDAVLVLSNSGETQELSDIILHVKRFSIPMIGVASRPESTLLQASDIALVLPPAPEACPVGLAPTTSTTLTIALGDALAVALMERREFTPEHFRMFHPGGRLGARLIKVEHIMAQGEQMPLVTADTPMSEALLVMSAKGYGAAGVIDSQGQLCGVITDGDLRRNMGGLLERRAGDVATPNPRTITADALAQEALALMTERTPRVTTLFVLDTEESRRPVGIVHVHDCLRIGLG